MFRIWQPGAEHAVKRSLGPQQGAVQRLASGGVQDGLRHGVWVMPVLLAVAPWLPGFYASLKKAAGTTPDRGGCSVGDCRVGVTRRCSTAGNLRQDAGSDAIHRSPGLMVPRQQFTRSAHPPEGSLEDCTAVLARADLSGVLERARGKARRRLAFSESGLASSQLPRSLRRPQLAALKVSRCREARRALRRTQTAWSRHPATGRILPTAAGEDSAWWLRRRDEASAASSRLSMTGSPIVAPRGAF